MKDINKRAIEKWRDYFTFNIADRQHKNAEPERKSAEELLTEITESDEY